MSEPRGTLVGEFWHNEGGKVDVSVETALIGLVYISLGLRIRSRQIQRAQFKINDWLIFIATLLMSVRYALEVTVVLKCGVGLHMTEVIAVGGPGLIVLFSKLLYVVDLFFVTILALVKISILHFYSVIFRQKTFVRCARRSGSPPCSPPPSTARRRRSGGCQRFVAPVATT
ncbi:hypothetical protein F5Y17DRAFT_243387 [Xylariaceae sp. FL0594]|nr:hypothetical protein F5Y17DRAFT_243387 [Xylariaceae sp. FL0594]